MKTSIKEELISYAVESIKDRQLDINDDDLHYYLFNEDYYIIGYYQASQWLKSHDLDPFEAISELIEFNNEHFGEIELTPENINSEYVVNQLVYFYGYELIDDIKEEIEK